MWAMLTHLLHRLSGVMRWLLLFASWTLLNLSGLARNAERRQLAPTLRLGAIVATLITVTQVLAANLHVDNDNAGTESGTALNPYRTVQKAIVAANAGDIIKIAAGTYNENVGYDSNIVSPRSFTLLGGWKGGSAADYAAGRGGDFATRNIAQYRAEIHGIAAESVILLYNPTNIITTVTIDGLRVTGGQGHDDWGLRGGGIYQANGTLKVNNCIFENNNAYPPGIAEDLRLKSRGGGVFGSDNMEIANSVFQNNQAGCGGAISCTWGNCNIHDNIIRNNFAISDHGGGLYLADKVELVRNLIEGNEVGKTVMYGWGGGFVIFGGTTVGHVAYNRVTNNYAPNHGSGEFVDDDSTVKIEHELIYKNRCNRDGGAGLYVDGLDASIGSNVTVSYSTIWGHDCAFPSNPDEGGGAIYVEGGSHVAVDNSIFWGNSDDEFAWNYNSSITLSNSLSYEQLSGTTVSADPLFFNAAGGDFHLMSTGCRYNQVSKQWEQDNVNSPALNQATLANGVLTELGVYGGTTEASGTSATQCQMILPFALTAAKTGSGTVTSNPTGINCGTDCSENYDSGTAVTLTATPAAGSIFAGWSGACSGTTTTCTVTMDADKSATATFNLAPTVPAVSTDVPSVITASSATLKGTVNPKGAVTTASFDFGLTTTYSTSIVATPASIAATAGATAVSANKTGLSCGTAYHYRVKAVNSAGTSTGADQSFTTAVCSLANLSVTVTDNKTSIVAGTATAYIATVTNAGPVAANGAVFKAPTVPNLTVTSVTCTATNGAACPLASSPALLQGTGLIIPSLPIGGKIVFTISATVAAAAPTGNLVYSVTVTPPTGIVDNVIANNTAKDSNRVVSRPDFIVTAIVLTPATPVASSNFTVAVAVKNQGGSAGDGGVLALWLNQAAAQVCNAAADTHVAVGTVATGASKVLTFTGLSAGAAGNKTLRLFVDNTCISAEALETNNQATKAYKVGGTPDVVITSITLNPTTVTASSTFSAVVTVKNQGTVTADAGYLDVWANQATAVACGADSDAWFDVGNVAAGASKTVTVSDIPAGVAGAKTLRAFIDSWCEVAESNEANNQLTKTYSVQ